MKSCSCLFAVEKLEGRNLLSVSAQGDFNNDGLMDVAELTNPTTITVRLANPDGSYKVAAILSIPKGQTTSGVLVGDFNNDGKLDVGANSISKTGVWYGNVWHGKGNGSFSAGRNYKISFAGF